MFYAVDNYLPEHNLVIEVMGDYWHCNPIKYSSIRYRNQMKTISRDKAKHTYLLNNHGIEVLYLWEHDIISSPELCKCLISEYISNRGKLSNYHSFNYNMHDGSLAIVDNLIIPYQDMSAQGVKQFDRTAS